MNYLILYLLVGAIVGVWTAINNINMESIRPDGRKLKTSSLLLACLLVSLAWPVSIVIFVYSIVTGLAGRQNTQDGY